ncbi:MAG: response regulator transcription factor [Planctomycetota bacterium]
MKGKTILVIDNDPSLCETIATSFAAKGAHTYAAYDGRQGLREFYRLRPDLVLLDIMLPDKRGLEILHQIRRFTDVPVISLNAGADDYVTKPVDNRVLIARADVALSRAQINLDKVGTIYDDGHLAIDPIAFRVSVNGSQVKLTATEFELLTYLVHNAGRACTFTQILANVWGERYKTNSEYVHAFIWQLRRKLEKDPKRPAYLHSVHGVGYRFESY